MRPWTRRGIIKSSCTPGFDKFLNHNKAWKLKPSKHPNKDQSTTKEWYERCNKNVQLSLHALFKSCDLRRNKLLKKSYLQEWSCKNNVYRIIESHRIHHSHLISLSKTKLFHQLTLRDALVSNNLNGPTNVSNVDLLRQCDKT